MVPLSLATTSKLEHSTSGGTGFRTLAQRMEESEEARIRYDALLANLRLSPSFKTGSRILVASTRREESKSEFIVCLAIAAQLAGYETLIVDGDLRRPTVTVDSGLSGAAGLGDLLEGTETAAQNLVVALNLPISLAGKSGSISFLPAGRRSAAFLPRVDWPLARERFQSLTAPYGMTLINSPAMDDSTDAALLAKIADGALLVVGAGLAMRDEVRRAKDHLTQSGAGVIGAVLDHG